MKDKIEEPECGCGNLLSDCMPDFQILKPKLGKKKKCTCGGTSTGWLSVSDRDLKCLFHSNPTSLEGNAPEGGADSLLGSEREMETGIRKYYNRKLKERAETFFELTPLERICNSEKLKIPAKAARFVRFEKKT